MTASHSTSTERFIRNISQALLSTTPSSSCSSSEKIQVIVKKQLKCVEMLTDEVQEVRYSLKVLREQMAARQNNNNNNKFSSSDHRVEAVASKVHGSNGFVSGSHSVFQKQEDEDNGTNQQLREMFTKHLRSRLQQERERLQAEYSEFQRRYAEEQNALVQTAEAKAEEQRQKVDEMQKLIAGLEMENATLRETLSASGDELKKRKEMETSEVKNRCAQLEEQLETLKNKNHILDDMLKSQQRKIRSMIEQVQNSRTVIDQRDRTISDLKEEVSFLRAENREMRDQMEYLGTQGAKHYNSDTGSKVVYSKPLTPTSPGNKSLPFIKVIEIKT